MKQIYTFIKSIWKALSVSSYSQCWATKWRIKYPSHQIHVKDIIDGTVSMHAYEQPKGYLEWCLTIISIFKYQKSNIGPSIEPCGTPYACISMIENTFVQVLTETVGAVWSKAI